MICRPDRQPHMRPLVTAIGIAIVIGTIALSSVYVMRSCARIPIDEAGRAVEFAEKLSGGLSKGLNLQPEIKIDRKTVIDRNQAVLELTTIKRNFTHEYVWEQKWAGSTKRIKLKGNFTAFAGFDLNEHFFIDIHSEDLRVDLKFPQPRLLACEMNEYTAEEDEGWWNKISPEERHAAINEMVASARRSMQENQGLQDEAKRMLELQVAGVIVQNGGTLRYVNDSPFKKNQD